MRRENLLSIAMDHDADDPPPFDRTGYVKLAPRLGGERIACNVFDLPQGAILCPYHYEYGQEEWLVVLTGTPTVRHPEGEDVLAAGDVVCFGEGPESAHQVRNDAAAPSRLIIFNNAVEPNVAVYPDSDKIGVWPGRGNADRIMVERSSGVDYWAGEA